ncbi:hypothetical protein F5880DRAFT_305172 [Lentinula raphanica]|nr:hypothetical protein F5880DRAFT_305172 [Lentinula raphanica]
MVRRCNSNRHPVWSLCRVLVLARWRAIKRRLAYESLTENAEMPITSKVEPTALMGGGRRAGRAGANAGDVLKSGRRDRRRELYDASGEVQILTRKMRMRRRETRLHPGGEDSHGSVRRQVGESEVGFHSDFLDDEDVRCGIAYGEYDSFAT